MKKVLILLLLLSVSPFSCMANDEIEEKMNELGGEVSEFENSDKTNVSALLLRIEALEELMKSLNNKIEELTRQINQYSNSLNGVRDVIDSKSNKSAIDEDSIKQLEKKNTEDTSKAVVKNENEIKQEFERAFTMLKSSDYEGAETAFTDFIRNYPKNDLTGTAYYWLGESFYQRKIYNKAALNYLYSIKNFPSGSKAELSAYKLAMSFSKLGKTQEACQSFTNFLDKFKKAQPSIIKSANDEMKKLSCAK